MKIRFTIGGKKEKHFSWDTKEIPNESARQFTEDLLTIFASAARGIRDRITEYENEHAEVTDDGDASDDTSGKGPAAHPPDSEPISQSEQQAVQRTVHDDPCAEALINSSLGARDIGWLPIGDSTAAVIPVLESDSDIELWRTAQAIVGGKGCYPILVRIDDLEGDFENIPNIVGAAEVHSRTFSSIRSEMFARSPQPVPEPITDSYAYKETVRRFGRGPSETEIKTAKIETPDQLDEFLWKWERETFGDEAVASITDAADFWYELTPDEMALLILPVADAASAIRILGFHPVFDNEAWIEPLINDVMAWEREHGAALIANYGTMLQFVVERPPRDLDKAYTLARQHDLVANATLAPAGVQIRHYAASLLSADRWHLHDRP
ncbi:MAG: DUF4253 domain-containing protein [Acidimicrobiia bacterium]|nr:DUF4253 domain-containing protein [Acidimicrobiia bacterium]